MEGFAEQAIERAGINASGPVNGDKHAAAVALYHNMVKWGWIDGLGRSVDWKFWNRNRD